MLSVCSLLELSDAGILSSEVVSSSRLGETGGGAPDSESYSELGTGPEISSVCSVNISSKTRVRLYFRIKGNPTMISYPDFSSSGNIMASVCISPMPFTIGIVSSVPCAFKPGTPIFSPLGTVSLSLKPALGG